MKIHEITRADGSLAPVELSQYDGELWLKREKKVRAVPEGALAAIMRRFGAPLDTRAKLIEIDVLQIRRGERLRYVRHLDIYDVIARDYLVYEAPDRAPECAMATTVAGALEHLARVAAGE